MNLSIIVPSIRTYNWKNWIDCIINSCKRYSYEIIFIGPEYSSEIEKYRNIKYVRDFGHPNRCQQIGILIAEGEYVTFGSDDCMYKPDLIDKCLDIAYFNKLDYMTTGYNEGGNIAVSNFTIRNCYQSGKNVEQNWIIFNSVFIQRNILEKYNLDTNFSVTCIGHTDLACRVQSNKLLRGAILNENIMECSHMPGRTGDHGPICDAQTFIDGPAFFNKYNQDKIPTDIIDWKEWKNNTHQVWKERFE